jgi:RimJ/RimL family protein N-acetyltransferase
MLKGKKTILRMFRDEEDCHKLLEAYNNIAQRAETDHTEMKHPQTLLKRFHENGLWGDESGSLLITDESDTIVGSIDFTKRSEFELEVGYRIYQKAHRRKGYVGEALPLLSAYLFETKPITRLRIQIAADNIGSRKVAEQSGYKEEGILRKAHFYRGKLCDFVIYGMLREESPKLADLLADNISQVANSPRFGSDQNRAPADNA